MWLLMIIGGYLIIATLFVLFVVMLSSQRNRDSSWDEKPMGVAEYYDAKPVKAGEFQSEAVHS